jgi:gliding motility-associated-like protein
VLRAEWETARPAEDLALQQPDDSREMLGCRWIWSYYSGAGTRVGVYDTGVWSGHSDLQPAVVAGPPDSSGHGTAVCGAIASRGQVELDCAYNGSGMGSQADLYVIGRPASPTPAQFYDAMMDLFDSGCFAANNSWGSEPSGYDLLCEYADAAADSGLSLVCAAGNNGAAGPVMSPAAAKNVFSVGALTYVPDSAGIGYVTDYSSRGPTRGAARLAPWIVAPGGSFTADSMARGVVTTNARLGGAWLDDPDDRWPGEDSYTRRAGTSMAAALVSGALSLCRQKYGGLVHPEDLMALAAASAIPLKANTGDPLSGYATVAAGYGLLDPVHLAGSYFSEEVDRPLWVYETAEEGQPAEDWTFYVPSGAEWISVAMAYCDVPGEAVPGDVAVRVDLDLEVESPTGDVYTHLLPAGVSAESPLERLVVEDPQSGVWHARAVPASWADPGNPAEEEVYSLTAYSVFRDPEVTVLVDSAPRPDTTIIAAPSSQLELPLMIGNSGGYVMAGASLWLESPGGFSAGRLDSPLFFGNVVYAGRQTRERVCTLQTPGVADTFDLAYHVITANRGLSEYVEPFTVILEYPDLTVSQASPSEPPPFGVGQRVEMGFVVTNQGTGPASPSELDVYLAEDPDSLGQAVLMDSVSVPVLEGSESWATVVPYTFTYFDLGTRYVVAVADADGQVEESDETDNTSVYGPFDVTGDLAPPSDLQAESGNDGFVPLTWSPPEPPDAGRRREPGLRPGAGGPGERGGKGLVQYRLYRSTTPVGPESEPIAEVPATDLAYTDSLVSNGITYYYWATGIYEDPYGESPLSEMASATPQGPSGSVTGTVSDVYTGRLIPDAAVSVEDLGLTEYTGDEGQYTLPDLPVGPVPVAVTLEGYRPARDTVTVVADSTVVLDFGLLYDVGEGMKVIPSPFTPNGDGINDVAWFIWPAMEGRRITVRVYDLQGVPLREISGTQPFWDGTDDDGGEVPGGLYVYYAESGGRSVSGLVCLAR